jgi:hypothetical protein
MTYNKIVIYDTINQNLQYLMYFGMIWNYDHFSKQNTKSNRIFTL